MDVNPRLNRRVRFRSLDGMGFYRISGLKALDYSVEAQKETDNGLGLASERRLL